MATLSTTKTERLMHEQTIDSSNLGVAQAFSDIQEKFGDQISQALQQDEATWKKFLQDNSGGKMAAKGQTGRSAERIGTLDLAAYLKEGSRTAYELTESQQELNKAGQAAVAQARSTQLNSFAKNAIIKSPDIAPPTPTYQNVTMAAFMDALKIGSSIANIATPFQ